MGRVLGRDLYGVYALVLVVPGLLQLFLGFGVNSAVIRYAAYLVSTGKPDEAKRYSRNAAFFLCMTGAAITLFNFAFAEPLAATLLHRPELTYYIQLVSLSTIGAALLQIVTFTAIGWNRMALSSSFQITQGAVKLVLSPLLVIIGLGVLGALWGHIVSLVAAGVLGVFAVYLTGLSRGGAPGSFVQDIRVMLRFGLLPYVGTLSWNLANSFAMIVLAGVASNGQFGVYSIVSNLLLPVTLVSASLVNGLFPAFSSFDGVGGDVKVAFRLAYKFVAFILTPIVVFLVPAASLLIHIFWGDSYASGTPYLQLLALAYTPIAFGYTVHPAFFNGFNRPRLTMLVYVSGAAALVVGAPLFAVYLGLGIYGIIYATFVSLLTTWAVGTFLADRYMGARLDIKANAAIVAVTAAAYLATAFLPTVAHSSVASLLLDLAVFFGVYLTLAPIAGAVNAKDLNIMDHAFRDLRGFGPVFGFLVRYERLMLSLRS